MPNRWRTRILVPTCSPAKFCASMRKQTSKVLSLFAGLAVATSSLVAVSPAQASDVGFGKAYISASQLSLVPGDGSYLLATYQPVVQERRRSLELKALFGEVVGYPADMPLMATVAVSGLSGVKLRVYLPSGTTVEATNRTLDFSQKKDGSLVVTLAPGLTSWSDATELAFTGTQAAINAALARVVVQPTSETGKLKVSYTVTRDEGAAYNVTNSHFYKFIDWATPTSPDYVAVGTNRTWQKALTDAATLTYKGVKGHLATVTTDSENNFVRDRLGEARNVFLAGSDKDREGQWKWYAGPEEGSVFWEARCAAADTCNGESTYIDRTPAVNTYSAWATSSTAPDDVNENEPNDWGAGAGNVEDFLVANRYVATRTTQDPRWNDVPGAGNFVGGYVVEFSGNVENYTDVYSRDVTLEVSPRINSWEAKRTSSKEVKVTGSIYAYVSPWKVEVQRRTGNGAFATVASVTPQVGTGSFSYVDKLPIGNTLRAYDYRFVVSPPGVEPRVSAVATIPIESKVAQLVANLTFKIGDQIAGLASSVFKGFGLKPKSRFKVTLRSDPVVLVDATAGSDGNVAAIVTVPDSTEPGDHTVTVEGVSASGEKIEAVATFSLDENGVVTQVSDGLESLEELEELPATGSQSMPMILVVVMLLTLGGAIMLSRRAGLKTPVI